MFNRLARACLIAVFLGAFPGPFVRPADAMIDPSFTSRRTRREFGSDHLGEVRRHQEERSLVHQ